LALQHLRSDKNLANLEASQEQTFGSQRQFRMSQLGAAPKTSSSSVSSMVRGGASSGLNQGGVTSILHGYSKKNIEDGHSDRRLRILGCLSNEELTLLCQDSKGNEVSTLVRIAMVRSWIMRRLIARQKFEPQGDLGKTSPPIVSRLYQVISDGYLGFSQAAKVTDVPFPFPYHNLIRILLWMYALLLPFLINSKIIHVYLRFAVNFLAVFAYFALCEVGDNLEDPFLPYDPNELPLQAIQHTFNARLLSLGMAPRDCSGDWTDPLTPKPVRRGTKPDP